MPIVILVMLMVLIIAAVPVGAVLGILSLSLDELFMRGRRSMMLGDFVWEQSIEYILVAIPMFILLGEIMLRTGLAQKMYGAVVQWLSWLPGGLMHANIGTSTIFAATSGSSVATAATVGTVSYPEIEKRGYNESLFLGSLAAGGTLGILIPPVDQPDPLRPDHRYVRAGALFGRDHSGHDSGQPFHAGHCDCLPDAPEMGW